MKTAHLVVDVVRVWLDVRFLRWARERKHPYHVHHGDRPTMPGYRRRSRRS